MEVGSLSVPITGNLGPLEAELEKLRKLLKDAENSTGPLNDGLDKVKKSAGGITAALRPLAGALAGVLGTQQLIQFTNTWTDLNSRVTLASGSVERGAAVIEQLQVIARRTYSSLEQTTESYIRNAQTLRDLGKSTQETLDYTEALNNALVVSGARGDHAASVQDALGKAMAMGKLSGDELNTVMTRGGRVAELLAERFGTAVSGLRQLGTDGKITGDVINEVLVGNLEKLRKEAEDMPATIGDAFLLIRNALLQTIGVFDQANEISGTLAQALIFVADNIQRILTYVATATVVWGAYGVAVIAVNAGLFTMTGALALVRAGLIRLGIGAIVVLAGELVYQFIQLTDRAGGFGNALRLLGNVAAGVWQGIVTSSRAIPLGLESTWNHVRAGFSELIEDLQRRWNDFLATFEAPALSVSFGGQSYELLGGLDLSSFKADLSDAGKAASDFRTRAAELREEGRQLASQGFDQVTTSLGKLTEAADKAKGSLNLSDDAGPNRTTPAVDPAAKRAADRAAREAERLREQYQSLISDGKSFIEQQGIEQQAIGKTELEAAKLRATFDLLNQARRAGINLTPTQVAELTTLGESMAEAEYQTRKLQERYDFAKDTFKGFFTDIKTELQNGASIWEAFGTAAANALQKIADKALDLALNGIFDIIFNSFGGAAGGGGGNLFTRLLGFENGTSYAPGGFAMVGERGPELVRLPGGSQVVPNNRITVPSTPSFGSGGANVQNSPREVNVYVSGARGNSEIREMVQQGVSDGLAEYDANVLPGSVQRVRENPRIRG